MKSLGPRFETGGFAIWVGGWLYMVSPLAGALAGLAFVLLGVGLQLKAERKHKQREYTPEINVNLAAWASAGGYRQHRVATVEACERHGWISLLHERTKQMKAWDGAPLSLRLRQLDLTEDGVIALGLWRERKLHSPPPELPTLNECEREIIELAQRAYDLGYALCAREPARKEAREMRKAGWWEGCWVANSVTGLVPSPLAVVEVFPERADMQVPAKAMEAE